MCRDRFLKNGEFFLARAMSFVLIKFSNPKMQKLAAPHLDSFNFMVAEGLDIAVQSILPMKIIAPNQNDLHLWIEKVEIGFPTVTGQGKEVQCSNYKAHPV